MFWFVGRKIGLFSAILYRKMFSASLQRVLLIFYLILLKTNVSVNFRVSYAVFIDFTKSNVSACLLLSYAVFFVL